MYVYRPGDCNTARKDYYGKLIDKDKFVEIDVKRALTGDVNFAYYMNGNFWYETEYGELFPVPADGRNLMLACEPAVTVLEHMKAHNKKVKEWNERA